MGDSDTLPQPETTLTEPLPDAVCDNAKPSIDILKEAKPSENIALPKTSETAVVQQSGSNTETPPKAAVETVFEPRSETKIETAAEAAAVPVKPVDSKSEVETKNDDLNKSTNNSKLKNRSDIFSLNDTKNLPSTIFSVGGAPSKTIHKTNRISSASAASARSSSETITTQDSVGLRQIRNPVTGQGVNSKDEYRNKPTRRRDGNPLLGVGYKDDDAISTHSGTPRIPPGGYSQGLW